MRTSNNDGDLYFALVVGFCGGLWSFFKGFRVYREFRVVEDTPTATIRSIAMGLVRVRGRARGERLIPSPVSHTPCYFYKVDIEKWKTEERSGNWVPYKTHTNGVRFYLADATGQVAVDLQNVEYDVERSCQRAVRSDHSSPAPTAAAGASDEELLKYVSEVEVSKVAGWVERRLEAAGRQADPKKEQMRQAVMGMLKSPFGNPEAVQQMMTMWMPIMQQRLAAQGPRQDPREEQARQAMLEAAKYPPGSPEFVEGMRRAATMTGDPKHLESFNHFMEHFGRLSQGGIEGLVPAADGRFRLTEYCIVPEHEYLVEGTCAENPEARDGNDGNLISKGQNEPTFLISSKPATQLEKGLRWRAVKMIFGGAAVAAVCLAILLLKLGLF
jgi:hypothetical protein